MTKYTKAATVGALGSFFMFVLMFLGINSGMAPFNIPPSAAFLEKLGLNVGPLPLLMHFGYGATWSVVLVFLFQEETDILKALGLAGGLWLFMMVALSPIIGWGIFGFGSAHQLASEAPLYLQQGPKYMIVTLLLHGVYGLTVGFLNPAWIDMEVETASDSIRESEVGV